MTAERELLEISQDKLVSLYLHDLLLPHCIPSFRTINWRGIVACHSRRLIFHAPSVQAEAREKTTVLRTGDARLLGRSNKPEAEKISDNNRQSLPSNGSP